MIENYFSFPSVEIKQSHVTMGTIDKNPDGTFTLKSLKQKQCIDGFCYLLQEIYGIENKIAALWGEVTAYNSLRFTAFSLWRTFSALLSGSVHHSIRITILFSLTVFPSDAYRQCY